MIPKLFNDLYRFRYVTYSYIYTNLKLRYRRSILGFLWTFLAPILNYLVMGLVFTLLFKPSIPNYAQFYFAGAVFFSLASTVLNRSPLFFIQNEHFIRKLYTPKIIFVVNGVAYESVNFLLSSSALIILGMFFGMIHFSLNAFYSLIPMVMLPFFILGISSLVATATVYFRDLAHLVPVGVQALFFGTPIVYKVEMIPEKYHFLIYSNPLYYFVEAFRRPLVDDVPAPFHFYALTILFGLVTATIGYLVVRWQDNKIIFKL